MSTSLASRARSGTLATALVAVAFVGFGLPASAHNFVVSSTPEQDEVLVALPESWQLMTNDEMLDLGGEGAGFALLITDDGGLFYGDGCVTIDGSTMATPAALGQPGPYSMVYQFISADGHTLSGELTFAWQPAQAPAPHVGLAEPPVCGETASAPAPEQSEPEQPEPSSAVTVEAVPQPIEPVSDVASPLFIAGVFAVVLAVAGVLTAAILRARARRTGGLPPRPEGTDV